MNNSDAHDRIARVAGKLLQPLGLARRPCTWGTTRVLGSFPPLRDLSPIGSRKNYFIHDGYQHRQQAIYFDDTKFTDQWQLEVYQFAREICDREALSSVYDFGCGSGYKLMKYLNRFRTVGIDVPETCQWLRRKYPDRVWQEADSFKKPDDSVDLVIASDVIEHLENPDELIATILDLRPRYAILSTPDRNLLRAGTHNGPPLNPAHIREWNFQEFGAYVKEHFELLEHFISCSPQATQCVLCRLGN